MYQKNSYTEPEIRVLIISDRLIDQAKKLSDYFCSAGIHVVGLVRTKQQALKLADKPIDYLIIAGFLLNESSYGIIEDYNELHKNFTAVHWAMLDQLISILCWKYKIPLKFERTLPMSEFTAFLQQYHSLKTNRNHPA